MTNLQQALKYLKKGYSIIPIKKGEKTPAITSWTKYQKQLPSEAEVKTWFGMVYADANIAIICGEVSGLIVVDVDVKSGGKETVKGLHMPITLTSNTPSGGNHYFFKWRKGLVGAKVGLFPGIDIRSDLSYVVVPYSKLPNGNYEWATEEDEIIADAPDWLEEKNIPKEQTDWNKKFMDKNGKGLRNMNSTQIAGKILYDTSVEMWDILGLPFFKNWNKEYNNPPLGEKELMTVWNSIKAKHNRNNPLEPDRGSRRREESPVCIDSA